MNEEKFDLLPEFPAWKAQIPDLLKRYQLGELIPSEYFFELFDNNPKEAGINAVEYQKRQLQMMTDMDRLKKIMLVQYKRDLQNVRAQGYRLVPPAEQAEIAEREVHVQIVKVLKNAEERVVNTDLAALNQDEKRRHMDASVRLINLANMAKNERKLVPHYREQDLIE